MERDEDGYFICKQKHCGLENYPEGELIYKNRYKDDLRERCIVNNKDINFVYKDGKKETAQRLMNLITDTELLSKYKKSVKERNQLEEKHNNAIEKIKKNAYN